MAGLRVYDIAETTTTRRYFNQQSELEATVDYHSDGWKHCNSRFSSGWRRCDVSGNSPQQPGKASPTLEKACSATSRRGTSENSGGLLQMQA